MNENELIEALNDSCRTGDQEADHSNADDLVIDFLRDIGYTKVADLLEELKGTWYYS